MTDESCSYWEPSNCEGSIHCQPRCPRFVDGEGEPWIVRSPTAGDREALVDMYDDFALGQQAQGLPPRTRPRIEGWLDDVLSEGCNFVVAGDDRIVGHALYTPTDDAEPEFAVFVHQDYQGRGIGTEVSKHVVAAAAAGDRDALTLVVEADNRTARRLYDRLGFETVERVSADQRGIQMGVARMRREFGPADAAEFRRPPVVQNRPRPAD